MGKLEEMQVERVDGVDRPATGHRWVIVKSEDAESVEKDYEGVARAALESLAKEEGVTVSAETAEALTALAKLLEMSVEFKSVEGAAVASEDTDETPEANADETPVTRGEIEQVVESALEKVLAKALGEDADEADEDEDDEPVEKAEPKSRQPEEQDEVGEGAPLTRTRKSARPSFSNIILGQ